MIIVREATSADVPAITEIFQACYGAVYSTPTAAKIRSSGLGAGSPLSVRCQIPWPVGTYPGRSMRTITLAAIR